jgi:hypothetical protein
MDQGNIAFTRTFLAWLDFAFSQSEKLFGLEHSCTRTDTAIRHRPDASDNTAQRTAPRTTQQGLNTGSIYPYEDVTELLECATKGTVRELSYHS